MERSELMEMLAGQFPRMEEEKERHARRLLSEMKGSVHQAGKVIEMSAYVMSAALLVFPIVKAMPGLFAMLVLMLYLGGSALLLWYYISWRIDFDASTGFIKHYTLFSGETSYHVSELMGYHVRKKGKKSLLVLLTDNGKQIVLQIDNETEANEFGTSSGYTDADKFYTYLALYRRYYFEKGSDLSPESRRQPVPAALPESMPVLKEGENDPNFTEAADTSAHKKVQLAKWTDAENPVRPTMPERSSAFPDPTKSIPAASAVGSNAPDSGISAMGTPENHTPSVPDRRTDVDVDALFERVLQQHGKTKDASVQKHLAPDSGSLMEQILRMKLH